MQTALHNPDAQAIATLLRWTVCNPNTQAVPGVDYIQWDKVKAVMFGSPITVHPTEVNTLVLAWTKLLASIAGATNMAYTQGNLAWLIGRIEERDTLALSLLMAMATMTPTDDFINLTEAAKMLGHKDTSVLRKWCADGRVLSAKQPNRNWIVARSEIGAWHGVAKRER